MRLTNLSLLCPLLATACMEMGNPGSAPRPDAGTTAAAPCDDLQVETLDLTISGSSGFADLPSGCWALQGKLVLAGPAISSLAKLGDLRSVTDLELDHTDLTAFDTVSPVDVTGGISIHDNARLADLTNLQPGGELTGLAVRNDAALTALALPHVTRVTGATVVQGNDQLASVTLGAATRLEGGVSISDDPVLATLDLHALQSVGSFTVSHDPALTTLGTLSELRYVHGVLSLDGDDALDLGSSMTGSITSVDLGISITNNARLTTLGQLSHAGTIAGAIEIVGNHQLGYCAAQEIDCCVAHVSTPLISDNLGSSCSTHSWCWSQQSGCRY